MSHLVISSPDGAGGVPGGRELDVRQYIAVLRQRWLLILAIVVVGLGAGYFRYSVTPRLFRGIAVVQISRQSLSAQLSGIEPFLENWWNVEYYPTQYRLLQSRGLAEKVVEDLDLGRDAAFLLQSAGAVSEADTAALANMATQLLRGLEIDPIEKTQLVEIEYRSADPEFAAEVANGFADAFINWGIEDRRDVAASAKKFLGQRIDELKGQIEETDRALKERQATESLLAVDAGAKASENQLTALTGSYTEAVQRRIAREARYRALLATPPETVAEKESAGSIGLLRRAQADRERHYASQLKTYKPEWPAMVELKAEIERGAEDLEKSIQAAVVEARQSSNSDFQAALREEQQLLNEIGRLRGEALASSAQTVELDNLRRELQNRQTELEGVLESQSRTAVQERLQAQGTSNVRIVDRAIVPKSPFQPNLRTDLSTGAGAALFLGVALAFLFSFLDRTIKTSEEAEQLMGLPTLGVVVDLSSKRGYGYGYYGYYGRRGRREADTDQAGEVQIELVTSRNPRLAVSESYRSLRAALLLSSAEELRAVAVTSPSAGEGKSTTAVNLACVLAQLGRRVLLLDGDLRKPRQHQILEVSNRVGLVTCLAGQADPDDIVLATSIESLFIAPAGPSSPNPSELLGSARMKEIVLHYQSSFDMVIFDTPPVLAVSDAILVGSECQGVIFCLRAGSTVREDAIAGLERLRLAEVKVLGTVLNRYQHRAGSSKGQRYYQYYAYAPADEVDSAA